MIVQSIFVQITFWWTLTTVATISVVPAAMQTRQKLTTNAQNVQLPSIPMASEDSVHMLTAIRFPPPALFFADPGKKWTMGDFEKPDKPSSYSVTDEDMTDTEHDEYIIQDQITTVAVEPEPESTTGGKPIDGTKDNHEQNVSSMTEKSIIETENKKETTTEKSIVETENKKETMTKKPIVETENKKETTTEKPIDETENRKGTTTENPNNGTRDGDRGTMTLEKSIDEKAADRRQWTLAVKNPSPSTRFEKLTVTFGRLKHQTNLWRPFRTVKLTSRPLPTPTSEIRFPQINYMSARQHYKKPATNPSYSC